MNQKRFRLTYLPALDGVRGIAVLVVVAVHAHVPHVMGGFIGVDIFFVLSGFLITSLLLHEADETGGISLRSFYARRALRLFPALGLLLAAIVLCPRLFGLAQGHASTIVGVTALYASNWAQGFRLVDMSVLGHTWSLAVEEQFYLLWPPVVALIQALRLRREWLIFIATAGIVVAAVLRVALWTGDDAWVRIYNGLDTRIDGPLVGALAALIMASLPNLDGLRRRGFRVAVVMAALALIPALHYGRYTDQVLYFGGGLALSLCVAFVLVGIVAGHGPVTTLLEWAPLVWVGRISYGLYLWHFPMIEGVLNDGRMARLGIDSALLIPIRITASVAVAAASFYVLERPILRLKRRFGSRIPDAPAPAGAAAEAHRAAPVAPRLRLVRGAGLRSTPVDGVACATCGTPLADVNGCGVCEKGA